MSKILLITIATGNYHPFIEPMVGSAREFFLSSEFHDVNFLVFTDKPTLIPDHSDIHTSIWCHRPWPYPTLFRYHAFLSQKDFISEYDYLFFCDADMLFVAPVGNEILADGLVATVHPGFYNKTVNELNRVQILLNQTRETYATKEDLRDQSTRIFETLHRLEDKLDNLISKHG